MIDRVELPSNEVEPKPNASHQFTDAENALIDSIIKELYTDDAKELEAYKAKLNVAEQEIIALKGQLKKIQCRLEEEAKRNMLTHKQMIDLRNKLDMYESQVTRDLQKTFKNLKVEVVTDAILSNKDDSRRRRLTPSQQGKASFFPTKHEVNMMKDEDDDTLFNTCFRRTSCQIS